MGFLGSIGGFITGGVKGLLTGGPIGAITGAVGGLIKTSGGGAGPTVSTYQPPQIIAPMQSGLGSGLSGFLGGGSQGPNLPKSFPGSVPEPGVMGGLQRFLPGGQSGYTGAPPGFHINKAYMKYLRGSAMGHHVQDPFGQKRAVNVVVKNRKMNPLNPRALRAALRRQGAAVSLMRRALRGSGYTVHRSGLGKHGRGRKRR